jgi:hypothetical protein
LKEKPLAPLHGQTASYGRVERVILAVGLAIRDIRAAIFLEPDNANDYPSQVANSPLEVKDLEALLRQSHAAFRYVIVQLRVHHNI